MEETLRIASEAPNVDLWRLVPFERHHYAEIPVLCQTGDRLSDPRFKRILAKQRVIGLNDVRGWQFILTRGQITKDLVVEFLQWLEHEGRSRAATRNVRMASV